MNKTKIDGFRTGGSSPPETPEQSSLVARMAEWADKWGEDPEGPTDEQARLLRESFSLRRTTSAA